VPFDAELMELLLDAVADLRVEKKRMFGFQALWAEGRIFALVWQGRIALKLPDETAAAQLAALPGSSAFWKEAGDDSPAGKKWINVPESFHDDPHELRRWAMRAYEMALQLPPPRKRRAKGRKRRVPRA